MSKEAVKSLKTLKRWITLLENSSGSIINNLSAFADRKNIKPEDIRHGKEILNYMIDSLGEK